MSAPQMESITTEPRWEPPRVFPGGGEDIRGLTRGSSDKHPEVPGMDGHAEN